MAVNERARHSCVLKPWTQMRLQPLVPLSIQLDWYCGCAYFHRKGVWGCWSCRRGFHHGSSLWPYGLCCIDQGGLWKSLMAVADLLQDLGDLPQPSLKKGSLSFYQKPLQQRSESGTLWGARMVLPYSLPSWARPHSSFYEDPFFIFLE